ncbi:MAG: class I SAM-dependent methyltransferase [Gammaproteobacteria bacterium]
MDRMNRQANDWTLSLLEIGPSDNVLEIGFGPGQAVEKVLSLVQSGKVAGVDLSEAMLAQATKRNLTAVQNRRLDLRCGDAASLPFPDNTFNKVFAINVIYFWEHPGHNLKEAWRVMKDGARIAIYMGDRDQMARLRITQTGLFHLYSGEDCQSLLISTGFRNTRFEMRPIKQGPVSRAVCTLGEK